MSFRPERSPASGSPSERDRTQVLVRCRSLIDLPREKDDEARPGTPIALSDLRRLDGRNRHFREDDLHYSPPSRGLRGLAVKRHGRVAIGSFTYGILSDLAAICAYIAVCL